jgi:hypothetical protein
MELSLTTPQSRRIVSLVRLTRFSAKLGIGALCLAWAGTGHAEIYKFVDDNGFVTYTNMTRPGQKPELVIPDATKTPSKASNSISSTKRKSSTRSSTPAYFPRVDTGTQRKRDDMRRQLLEEEMSSEQRNLAAAKSSFAQGSRQPGADLKKLMDAVRLHEKNIEMLNKELSHIR